MATLNCLICGKQAEVTLPCFIQMCDECSKKVNWGDEVNNGGKK